MDESSEGKRPREGREERRTRIAERVRTLPEEPGCYLMKDRQGEIFYIGKAANLRARVRGYFSGHDTRQFVDWLDDLLYDIDYVIVRSEKEALLLERTLVREHQPRFNVKLRDDKNFIHLRLDTRPPPAEGRLRQRYPRVEVVRNAHDDGARYFGPYHSATAARSALRVLNKHFQLRTCRDAVLENRARPCLQHQIGRCPAPCVEQIPDYHERVAEAALFLSGKTQQLEARLKQRMLDLADAELFESAAKVRDQLAALRESLDDQVVTDVERDDDADVIAAHRSGSLLVLARVIVRDGRMQGSETHTFDKAEFPTEELVLSFLMQLYGEHGDDGDAVARAMLPRAVYVSVDLGPEAEALGDILSERAGRKVLVHQPQRGHYRRLLEIAEKNAAHASEDLLRKRDTREKGLEALQRRLSMERPPRVIECYDISLLQGTDAVASQVCFVDGAADKSRYRRYNIRTVAGTDDFAMLHETLVRRLKRGKAEGDLPDLLIVDGGKGQLAVAVAACKDVGVPFGGAHMHLASIAKARSFSKGSKGGDRPKTLLEEADEVDDDDLLASPERLFLPGVKDPLVLKQHTAERFLIEQVRDEAHRFAVAGHRGRRARRTLRSVLDEIPGIGPKKRRALLDELGSLDAIAAASVEDIAKVKGLSRALALRIKGALDPTVDAPADDDLVDPPAPDEA